MASPRLEENVFVLFFISTRWFNASRFISLNVFLQSVSSAAVVQIKLQIINYSCNMARLIAQIVLFFILDAKRDRKIIKCFDYLVDGLAQVNSVTLYLNCQRTDNHQMLHSNCSWGGANLDEGMNTSNRFSTLIKCQPSKNCVSIISKYLSPSKANFF